MVTYKLASEVITKNQVAIALFTHGDHFSCDSSGNGWTGKWAVNPEMLETIDKVIIYLRRNNETVNRVYLGTYTGTRPADVQNRHIIRFSDLQEVGTTEVNWIDFTGAGQNPVCYISR
jgi:hypothetical protein